MRTIVGVAALLGLVLALRPARADDKPDAAAVLARGIQALGGEAALAKYRAATWKARGKFHTPSGIIDYEGTWAMQTPDRFRADVTGEADARKYHRVRVLAGAKGWVKADDGETKEMSADLLAEARRELQAQGLARLVPLRDGAVYKLEATGADKLGDTPAVGLKVTDKDGHEFHLEFDKQTGLLLRVDTLVKPAGAAQEVRQEVLYADYKEAGGIKHAMKITVKRDGRTVLEQEFTDYQPHEKLDDKEFAQP